jgi:hypothetical protein
MNERIHIAPCRFGLGVFAAAPIREGEEILRFSGPLIDLPAALALGERQCDPLQIGAGRYMAIGAPGVLVNHSCAPNAGIVGDCILIALRDIAGGEEIFYDYSTTIDDDPWTLACQCGDASCRSTVGEFRELPAERRLRYLRLQVVQGFIAGRFLPADAPDPRSMAS